jgi:small-conductance mechanosensitive channel
MFFNSDSCLSFPVLLSLVKAGLIAVLGCCFVHITAKGLHRIVSGRTSVHVGLLIQKLVFYGLMFLLMLSVLSELGFNITALLGTAGIIGIAIGFAARTSVANIISGIFLLFEQVFIVGDYITVNSLSGTIESIDLLSAKIRTDDGLLIRIPHEMLLTGPVTSRADLQPRRCILTVVSRTNVSEAVLSLLKNYTHILKKPGTALFVDEMSRGLYTMRYIFWVAHNATDYVNYHLIAHLAQQCMGKSIAIQALYLNAPVLPIVLVNQAYEVPVQQSGDALKQKE